MEDTLREDVKNFFGMNRDVLILVLMEDTLRAEKKDILQKGLDSLNPCFNGRYSQRRLECVTPE